MEVLAVGDVVLVLFPYADFSQFKKRPALIVGKAEFGNFILCQVTSKSSSAGAIVIKMSDFVKKGLTINSYVRPDKIFTVEGSIIEGKIGTLKKGKLLEVHAKIRRQFH